MGGRKRFCGPAVLLVGEIEGFDIGAVLEAVFERPADVGEALKAVQSGHGDADTFVQAVLDADRTGPEAKPSRRRC